MAEDSTDCSYQCKTWVIKSQIKAALFFLFFFSSLSLQVYFKQKQAKVWFTVRDPTFHFWRCSQWQTIPSLACLQQPSANIYSSHHQSLQFLANMDVTECIVCVQGHDPLTFSFLSSSFLIGCDFLRPQLSKMLKLVRWASVPAEAGCLFAVAACVHLRGEPTLFPGWCN